MPSDEKHFFISDFKYRFEEINLSGHNINIEIITLPIDIANQHCTAFTTVDTNNLLYQNSNNSPKTILGPIVLSFRNQGLDKDLQLNLNGHFVIRASMETQGIDMVYKTFQYLFDWIKLFVAQNNITDKIGNAFITPGFSYSRDQFASDLWN